MDNHLLYGTGTTTCIVATENIPGQEGNVQIWERRNGDLTSRIEQFEPFIYVNENDLALEELHNKNDIVKLLGNNHYNVLVKSKNYGVNKWVLKNADDAKRPFLQSQWMIHTGETQFFGMDFDDPLRLYFDIETDTKEGFEFPNSSREEDKITIITMRTNQGLEKALCLNDDGLTQESENIELCGSEKELLQKFVKTVRMIDPDIMLGHNIFGFDLRYITDRCMLCDVELKLGRDGSVPSSFHTTIKFADKADDYENFTVYGRHLIDTYFLAKQYDVVARKLSSYGLKACVKELGLESEERVYVPGNRIAAAWNNRDPEYTRSDLINYAFDDVRETQILDREWGGNIFAQTQMCPLPMQDVSRYGTGNKIDLLFIREYYRMNWSLPTPEPKRKFSGGYAGTGVHGFINKPLAYIDVGSMYPTLSELLIIMPKNDELQIYQEMIKLLKSERYKAKNAYNKHKELAKKGIDKELNMKLASRYNATNNGLKIYLNTGSYGYLGSEWGLFNDYDEAERITTNGRAITKQMLKEAQSIGCQTVKWDTDGMLVTVPEEFFGDERSLAKLIESLVNDWISEGGLS